jgi:O-antigen/teichoic acid export membrane protein
MRLVIQLGSQIVLARLLGPAEYGLFAIAVMAVSLSVFASDIASSALIHAPQLDNDQIRFAFTWQILCGLFLAGGLALIAEPLAVWLKQPDVALVILVASPICFLNALGGVSLALLRRQLDYGTIQLWQTAGYFVGYVVVGIPLAAYTNAGVWALVTAWGVQSAIATFGFIWRAPHGWHPLFNCVESGALVKFGRQAMLANFSNWALSNIDRLVVARTAPIREMGLYSTMINLLSTPLAQVLGTYQSVAFSASARSGDDAARATFIIALAGGSLIVCLMFGVVLAIPDTIILALYGPKWIDAVPYTTAFAIGFIAYGTQATITPLLWGRGAVEREAVPQFVMAILLGVTAWIASEFSTLAVAWAFAGVNILRCAWIVANGAQLFEVIPADMLSVCIRSVIPASLVGFGGWFADQMSRSSFASPLIWVACDALAVVVMAWLLYIMRRYWMQSELIYTIDSLCTLTHRNGKAT